MNGLKYSGDEFWKNYMDIWFGSELIKSWEDCVKLEKIRSNNKNINLELYIHDKEAPTIIFSHGIAGYARVLLPFIIPLYKSGYNIIVPDLEGYGYNDGLKGDFTWNNHVQNLVDCVEFASKNFNGSLYIGGASMGGPLAYSAACRISDKIKGLVTWCLWDFSDKEFMLNETITGKFTYLLIPFLSLISKLFGNCRVKTYNLISYETLTGSDVFNTILKKDPQAGTYITLKGALSLLLDSKPLISHKDFNIPTLVVQPGSDRMTPVKYIKNTYESLGSSYKKYVEVDGCEHFTVEKEFYDLWLKEVTEFITKIEEKK